MTCNGYIKNRPEIVIKPNTHLWLEIFMRGSQLNHRDNFNFTFTYLHTFVIGNVYLSFLVNNINNQTE